jgi:hypothetical protein
MIRPVVIASLVFLASATLTSAQSPSSSSSPPNSSSGTSRPQDSPKEQQAFPASAKPPEPQGDKKKPKRVWTNDELGSVKGGVSVVGDHSGRGGGSAAASSSARPPSPSDAYAPPTNYEVLVRTYLDKLAPLRANLADIDRNIQKAKDAMGNAREDTAAWIRVYQEKRLNVLAKIEAIEEEAHQRGVLPGDLR